MATLPVQLDEESLIREQIAQLKLAKGVKFERVEQNRERSKRRGIVPITILSASAHDLPR